MKIYKYRDLTNLNYIYQIILHKKIWCAGPDSFKDPDEFRIKCDYRPNELTHRLLTQLLVTFNHRPIDLAQKLASLTIKNNRL